MSQHYSDPAREDDHYALPNVEVFEIWDDKRGKRHNGMADEEGNALEPGWYYWCCFPGCLPDSAPVGPFATEAEALADAQEDSAEVED